MPRSGLRSRPDKSGFAVRNVSRGAACLCGSEIGCGLLAAAPVGLNVIPDLLTLSEAAHTRTVDGADVHEHILAALVGLDEAITLLFVEPLHSTGRHCMSFHGR